MKKVVIVLVALLLVVSLSNSIWALGDGNQNLLVNADFELAGQEQKPDYWRADYWQPDSKITVTTKKVHKGKYALEIISDKVSNDARLLQTVQVEPNTYYKLSGWVTTENVTPQKIGANLCVMSNSFTNSSSLNDTIDWTYLEFNFKTTSKQTEVTVGPRLGMWGNDVKGAAYFDDLSLVKLNNTPSNFQALQDPTAQTNTQVNTQTAAKSSFPIVGWVIIFILLALIVVFIIYKKMRKNKNIGTEDDNDIKDANGAEIANDKEDTNDMENIKDITGEGNDDENEDQNR